MHLKSELTRTAHSGHIYYVNIGKARILAGGDMTDITDRMDPSTIAKIIAKANLARQVAA